MAISFFKSLLQKFTGRPVDWDELEEALIRADLGVSMTTRILQNLQARPDAAKLTAETVVAVARDPHTVRRFGDIARRGTVSVG